MIARLIESAAGSTLASTLERLVFTPAGLKTAHLAITPDDLRDVHMGDMRGYYPGWVYRGLVVGRLEEAARLLHHMAYGALLAPRSLAPMKEWRPLPDFRSEAHPDPAYGLGLMLTAQDTETGLTGHSGAGPGSRIAVYASAGRVAATWAASSSRVEPDMDVRARLEFGNAGHGSSRVEPRQPA